MLLPPACLFALAAPSDVPHHLLNHMMLDGSDRNTCPYAGSAEPFFAIIDNLVDDSLRHKVRQGLSFFCVLGKHGL